MLGKPVIRGTRITARADFAQTGRRRNRAGLARRLSQSKARRHSCSDDLCRRGARARRDYVVHRRDSDVALSRRRVLRLHTLFARCGLRDLTFSRLQRLRRALNDDRVIEMALHDRRILITEDKDFGTCVCDWPQESGRGVASIPCSVSISYRASDNRARAKARGSARG